MDDDLLQPEGGDGEAGGGHAGPSKDIAARLEALRRENAIGPSASAGGSQPSSRSARAVPMLAVLMHATRRLSCIAGLLAAPSSTPWGAMEMQHCMNS